MLNDIDYISLMYRLAEYHNLDIEIIRYWDKIQFNMITNQKKSPEPSIVFYGSPATTEREAAFEILSNYVKGDDLDFDLYYLDESGIPLIKSNSMEEFIIKLDIINP